MLCSSLSYKTNGGDGSAISREMIELLLSAQGRKVLNGITDDELEKVFAGLAFYCQGGTGAVA